MPCEPDITIRAARPEWYNSAARRARATVAGCGWPSAVMPPPRATTTPALTGDTSPMLHSEPPQRNCEMSQAEAPEVLRRSGGTVVADVAVRVGGKSGEVLTPP